MSYSIKIVNNENGEVLIDEAESIAIVGAVSNKEGAHAISYSCCNAIELFTTLAAAQNAVENSRADAPVLKLLESYLSGLTGSDK